MVVALLLDLVMTPLLGGPVWMPYFTLAVLPAIFLFAPSTVAMMIALLEVLVLWLASSFNVGILVFVMGLLLFYERWAVPKLLHITTWQAMGLAAVGLPIFLGFLFFLSSLLLTEIELSAVRMLISGALSTVASLVLLVVVKKHV